MNDEGASTIGTASTPRAEAWAATCTGFGISDKVIQAILRHANVSVTLSYYVKSTSADVAAAMEKLEAKIAEDSRDTSGTPKADPGASRGFVN